MKIGILGTGGVGGYFGGLLAKAGLDVTFVARGDHYQALRERGLTVKAVTGDFVLYRVKVVESISKLEPQDVVLITTKSYDLEGAIAGLDSVIMSSTIVIPLLNGIDHDLMLRKRLSKGEVHPGLVYIISTKTAPGLIEQTAGPRTLFFGDRTGRSNPRLEELAATFREAGVDATNSTDIVRDMWRKYVWLSAFAGLTGMCRSPIGMVCNDEVATRVLLQAIDEGLAVARALGVDISEAMRDEMIAKSLKYRTTDTHAKSSLLVDLENNRPSEIETLNGTMVRLGNEHGVPVLTHQAIYAAIKLGARIPDHVARTIGR